MLSPEQQNMTCPHHQQIIRVGQLKITDIYKTADKMSRSGAILSHDLFCSSCCILWQPYGSQNSQPPTLGFTAPTWSWDYSGICNSIFSVIIVSCDQLDVRMTCSAQWEAWLVANSPCLWRLKTDSPLLLKSLKTQSWCDKPGVVKKHLSFKPSLHVQRCIFD